MSSILKALKRIEGQSPPPEEFPALPESVDAKQAVNSTARKRWRLRRIITITLVVLIIAIGTVIVFLKREYLISKISPGAAPATHSPENRADGKKSKIFRAKVPASAVKRPPRKTAPKQSVPPAIKTVTPGQKSKKKRTVAQSTPTRKKAAAQPSKSRPAISRRSLKSTKAANKPAPGPLPRKKFSPSSKSIAGKRTAAPKPSVKARKTTNDRTYAKLTDGKIKLQALAWSSDAARRMAVINGRIVREGASMEGYQINQIRKDDVIVSDGRQSWSLEFGLKR